MQTVKYAVQVLRTEFRDAHKEYFHGLNIGEKNLADVLGVCQSTISRVVSYEGESEMPLWAVPLILKAYPEYGLWLLDWLKEHTSLPTTGLNGTPEDELLGIFGTLGRAAEMVRSGKIDIEECRKLLYKGISEIGKAIEELNSIQKATA